MRLFIARALWLMLVSVAALLFIIAFPAHYRQLSDDPFGFAKALTLLNLPPDFFAIFGAGGDLLVAVVCASIGVIIFLRRSNDSGAILISLALCSIMLAPLPVTAVLYQDATFRPLIVVMRSLAVILLITVFFIFPNGRFVPSWTRWLSIAFFPALVVFIFGFGLTPPSTLLDTRTPSDRWFFVSAGLAFAIGALSQMHRYRHVSTPTERQQTKWVVAGLTLLTLCFVSVTIPLLVVPELSQRGSANLVYTLIGIAIILTGVLALPLSIGFSILHYRLWDIDILIRRTLIYSIITAMLLLFYFGSVALLQNLLSAVSGQQSEIAIIISTLAIAALFNPLRHRVQAVIDQRFYRHKYDAQQVLAKFAHTARDEVELEKLTGALVNVVSETMQPTSISLWLRQEQRK